MKQFTDKQATERPSVYTLYTLGLSIIISNKIHNRSEERKVRGSGVGDEDCTDDVSSGAGATSPAASPRPDDDGAQSGGSGVWPSMQDLNTRLRRLITAYQRNYKREELKLQQRAKVKTLKFKVNFVFVPK